MQLKKINSPQVEFHFYGKGAHLNYVLQSLGKKYFL